MKSESLALAHEANTLVQMLRTRAKLHPQRPAYTFLRYGEVEEATWSYAELDQRARALAVHLAQQGVAPGDRAALLYLPDDALEFVAGFFGCLYAGVVAVPVFPPGDARTNARFISAAKDSLPKVGLTTSMVAPMLEQLVGAALGADALKVLPTDGIPMDSAETYSEASVDGASLAFLQYTSGSTSQPRGVKLSHENLLAHSRMIAKAMHQDEEIVFICWQPLIHDAGLVGNVISNVVNGSHCVFMSPDAFLKKPIRWLRAIGKYGKTISGGPNFAYELCIRRIAPEELAGLDLGRWTVAWNGSEPIRAETFERFSQAFSSFGFQSDAFFPCYGLAEASLLVSGGPFNKGPYLRSVLRSAMGEGILIDDDGIDSLTLAASGAVFEGQTVRIVDPKSCELSPPDRIGEIWVAGPNVASGYWKNEAATNETFNQTLSSEPSQKFLRTGDLGFLFEDRLFIAGRIKDLIILRGRNLHPQDIELAIENSHSHIRPGCVVAYVVDGCESEGVGVTVEIRKECMPEEWPMVISAAHSAARKFLQLSIQELSLLPPNSTPKTTSGKLQRRACRDALANGTLAVLHRHRFDGFTKEQSGEPVAAN